MVRSAVIELYEDLKFSAGHFMVHSTSERESMHGHDYQLHVSFTALIKQNGMAFDCRFYKKKLLKICQTLDYRFILPAQSEYLRISEEHDKWLAHFDQQVIPFWKEDAVILPICNVTLEELSYWFLQELTTTDLLELEKYHVEAITVKVLNGRGESGASSWVL